MNLSGEYSEWTVTQTALGRILGLTVGRVNQLIDEGVVLRDERSKSGAVFLVESIKNYYQSKNEYVTKGKSVNFWQERGLHERAKRRLAELKLRERRGELYESDIVESVMQEQLTNFRNKLLGLPAKLSQQLEGKPRGEIYNRINIELEELLSELTENYSKAVEGFEESGRADEADDAGDESD